MESEDYKLEKSSKIGLRKVELVQEQIGCSYPGPTCSDVDGGGKTFFFKVNDIEVFIKGANMVPIDYFPKRMFQTEELEWLFESAQASNLNLLRLWGGGMYMTDEFYEMADSKVFLIWQDTMFSCKFYPYMDQSFIENSVEEVRE